MAEQERAYTVRVRETVEFSVAVRAPDAGTAGAYAVDMLMEGHGRDTVEWADVNVSSVVVGDADLCVLATYDWNQPSDAGLPGKRMFSVYNDNSPGHRRLAIADSPTVALARAEEELADV